MIIPVGSVYGVQNLILIEKRSEEDVRTRNVLPVRGEARLCAVSALCTFGLRLPFGTAGGERGFGIGGSWAVGGFGPTRISISAAPWTLRTATVTATTAAGVRPSTSAVVP